MGVKRAVGAGSWELGAEIWEQELEQMQVKVETPSPSSCGHAFYFASPLLRMAECMFRHHRTYGTVWYGTYVVTLHLRRLHAQVVQLPSHASV